MTDDAGHGIMIYKASKLRVNDVLNVVNYQFKSCILSENGGLLEVPLMPPEENGSLND
jgi:hypothetical protein